MAYEVECSACGNPARSLLEYKCSSCGHPLEVKLESDFQIGKTQERDYTAWRYADAFPYVKQEEIITLGEGWTPLVRFSRNVHFKLESLNPTGSFKDRGSTTLISAIHKSVRATSGSVAEDSSGNAGASVAAYAARANVKARIYVPESVSGPKFSQIKSYGAEVVRVSGNRGKVAEEAQRARDHSFYIGHILHPLFRDGIRTLAYEIAEQLNWHVSDGIYLPVSAGTLLLGVLDGLKHLVDSNVIENMPRVTACQTKQVSPLYHRIKNLAYAPPERIVSIADALVSVNPPLLDIMVKRLSEAKGDVVVVDENQIRGAFRELARSGFHVEPSSAVAYAGYRQHVEHGLLSENDSATVVLTGMGLKSTSVAD